MTASPMLWVQFNSIGIGLKPLRIQGDYVVCWCSSGFKVTVPRWMVRRGLPVGGSLQPQEWRPGVPSWGRR